ncbi:hypothetical protein IJ472_01350 [bacterium]|nr:hypothetical protein [bacterium]
MDINEIEEIKFQDAKLSDSATNYELTKENVNEKNVQIFNHYDTDKNNKLDKVEMSGFRADIDAVNTDKNVDKLSKKEAKNFLGKVFSNEKHSTKELSSFINDVERNYIKTMTTKSDGVVDNFMQGKSGDCWLLSQVSAMADTEWGAKAIKESIINDKENNKYQIRLNGVGYQTEIGYEEIQALRDSKKYSSGDIDMLLLEVGIERYLKQEADAGRIERFENPLDCAQLIGKISVQNLLLGNVGNQFYNSPRVNNVEQVQLDATQRIVLDDLIKDNIEFSYNTFDKEVTRNLINELANNPEKYAITCHYRDSKNWEEVEKYSKSQQSDKLRNMKEHSYKIEEFVKDENGQVVSVILENPWNSKVKIIKSLEDFLNQVLCIGVTADNADYDNLRANFDHATWDTLDI